jgi:hypothetical protein
MLRRLNLDDTVEDTHRDVRAVPGEPEGLVENSLESTVTDAIGVEGGFGGCAVFESTFAVMDVDVGDTGDELQLEPEAFDVGWGRVALEVAGGWCAAGRGRGAG